MPADATLADLDTFLRLIWVECCEHLSKFTIQEERYSAPLEEWGDLGYKPIDIPLNRVLGVGDAFEYVYDFGSSTYLEGQVIEERAGVLTEGVKVLARNNPPKLTCRRCRSEAEATQIWIEDMRPYCDRCLEERGISEEMTLPVVNSPRMGVCGYTGDHGFDRFVIPAD